MRKIGKIFLWLVGIFLVVEIVGISVLYFSRRIKPSTVLTVRIEGSIPEQSSQDQWMQLLAGRRTTVTDIVEALEHARTDPRITGVEVRVGESLLNMAKMQEIRQKIREFNRAGKFSVAYLEFATNRTYYLASACQTVIFLPKSLLFVRGMMASSTFLRGTFDKLGIYPDFYHIGEYKTAPNLYTEKKYTQAHRESTLALLEDWSGEFIRGVAEGRGLKPEEVMSAIKRGPLSSEEALAAKLVDRVGYADEARDLLRQKNQGKETRLNLREYLRRVERKGRSKLAVIYATGTILPGRSGDDPLLGDVMGSETVTEQFRRAREDNSLKAVVLRVDSPGGVDFSSEAIRRELVLTKKIKPVVVSMSDVAASGGYWISMSANKIVAEPGTITGSIGVYVGKFNLLGLYNKLGLSKDFIATADNSTLEWPFQNFTPAQRETILRHMRDTYENFVQGVAEGRQMKVGAVDKIAQGRVWSGARARQLGLVDELGGLHTAIAAAKQLAKIPESEKVSLVFLPPPKSLFEKILELMEETSVSGPLTSDTGQGLAGSPREWLERLEALARLPVWALLPAVPQVQ